MDKFQHINELDTLKMSTPVSIELAQRISGGFRKSVAEVTDPVSIDFSNVRSILAREIRSDETKPPSLFAKLINVSSRVKRALRIRR